jgi:hypothetical protein
MRVEHIKTLKVRVKDKHAAQLNNMARSVNFVWNYINELSHRSITERGVFLSGFDIDKQTKGANMGVVAPTTAILTRPRIFLRSGMSV